MKLNISIFLLIGVMLALLFVLTSANTSVVNKSGDTVPFYIKDKKIEVEVVDTNELRQLGLSGRKSLPKDQGMLFVFDKSDTYGIWMKNMLFALDIIWLDEMFTIVHIEERVHPDTFPQVFRSEGPAFYVLELQSGSVDKFGIEIGDQASFEFISEN